MAEEVLSAAPACANLDARAADFVNTDKGIASPADALCASITWPYSSTGPVSLLRRMVTSSMPSTAVSFPSVVTRIEPKRHRVVVPVTAGGEAISPETRTSRPVGRA